MQSTPLEYVTVAITTETEWDSVFVPLHIAQQLSIFCSARYVAIMLFFLRGNVPTGHD